MCLSVGEAKPQASGTACRGQARVSLILIVEQVTRRVGSAEESESRESGMRPATRPQPALPSARPLRVPRRFSRRPSPWTVSGIVSCYRYGSSSMHTPPSDHPLYSPRESSTSRPPNLTRQSSHSGHSSSFRRPPHCPPAQLHRLYHLACTPRT